MECAEIVQRILSTLLSQRGDTRLDADGDVMHASGTNVYLATEDDVKAFSRVDVDLRRLVGACLTVNASHRPSPAQVLQHTIFTSLAQTEAEVAALPTPDCNFLSAAMTPRSAHLPMIVGMTSPGIEQMNVNDNVEDAEVTLSVAQQLRDCPTNEVLTICYTVPGRCCTVLLADVR